jgi:hypothetical protein
MDWLLRLLERIVGKIPRNDYGFDVNIPGPQEKVMLYGDASIHAWKDRVRLTLNKSILDSLGINKENYKDYFLWVSPPDEDTIVLSVMDKTSENYQFYVENEILLNIVKRKDRNSFMVYLDDEVWLKNHPHKTHYTIVMNDAGLVELAPYSRDGVLL